MEKEINEIKRLVDEVILGNDNNFEKLKKSVKDFFKDKTQQELDNIGNSELKSLVKLHTVLFNKDFAFTVEFTSLEIDKKTLTEVERAILDRIFHKEKPIRYIWKEIYSKINEEQLKKLTQILANELTENKKEELFSFTNWIIEDNMLKEYNFAENTFEENKEKDFRFELVIDTFDEYAKIELFLIGNKRHEKLIKECTEIFS